MVFFNKIPAWLFVITRTETGILFVTLDNFPAWHVKLHRHNFLLISISKESWLLAVLSGYLNSRTIVTRIAELTENTVFSNRYIYLM